MKNCDYGIHSGSDRITCPHCKTIITLSVTCSNCDYMWNGKCGNCNKLLYPIDNKVVYSELEITMGQDDKNRILLNTWFLSLVITLMIGLAIGIFWNPAMYVNSFIYFSTSVLGTFFLAVLVSNLSE